MRRSLLVPLLPLAGVVAFYLGQPRRLAPDSPPAIPVGVSQAQAYFSPGGGCTAAIVAALDAARTRVRVQAYSFTSAPIAKALVAAARRGVKVEVILDDSQRSERYSSADYLVHAGVPTWIDARHAIAHNKVMVIDGDTVITGSFNFTKAAESKNAENLLVLRNVPALAAQYEANWAQHQAHAEPYQAKTSAAAAPGSETGGD
jgi:phosphatidylserine/phosphatidylglycerophosphate/cardiolipin synthase-like enzyme